MDKTGSSCKGFKDFSLFAIAEKWKTQIAHYFKKRYGQQLITLTQSIVTISIFTYLTLVAMVTNSKLTSKDECNSVATKNLWEKHNNK